MTAQGPGLASRALIALTDVSRSFTLGGQRVDALRGVSFDVAAGEYVAIVGPSGCGKSTLLNVLGGVDRPTSGVVEIDGRDVATFGDREATGFRLRRVGFVFQRFYLMPTLSARENVELPMAEAGVQLTLGGRGRASCSRTSGWRRARRTGRRSSPAASSSASRSRARSRTAAALVLADEPTGELDARTGAEIIALFQRLNADGTTIVVVTHDERLAQAARRVVHMADGRIVADGETRPTPTAPPPDDALPRGARVG